MSIFAPGATKHDVFVSFHHKDEPYKEAFVTNYGQYFTSKCVDNGDIDPDNEDEYIKKLIQENHISESSVVVVLYGAETCDRKHVDWEISAGLNQKVGGHSGLVVLIVPGFPGRPFNTLNQYDETFLYPHLHPRTVANLKSGFAKVYYWPGMFVHPSLVDVNVGDALHEAFERRVSHKHLIDNSHIQYKSNR